MVEPSARVQPFLRHAEGLLLPGAMIVVTLFFMAIAIQWRPLHDSQLMMYCGFIMEEFGKIPYRDFFEMNAPGVLLLHQGVIKLIGTSEWGQRLWDLSWLLAIQATVFLYLKRWGVGVGVCAACVFSIQYLSGFPFEGKGPIQSLQREYLCVLPLAISLLVAFRFPGWTLHLRAFGIGLLIGASATIKPNFVLYFPLLFAALWIWEKSDDGLEYGKGAKGFRDPEKYFAKLPLQRLHRRLFQFLIEPSLRTLCATALAGLAGLMVFPMLCAGYLVVNGAGAAFWEMAREYWPLYLELGPWGRLRTSPYGRGEMLAALKQAIDFQFLGLLGFSVIVALPGLLRAGGRQAVEIWTLIGVCVGGFVYLIIGGKSWPYHALPLNFGYSLLVGFSLLRIGDIFRSTTVRWLRCGILLLLFFQPLHMPFQATRILEGNPNIIPNDITHVANLIEQRARPGDQIQPLDVTNGAVHAMLLSQMDIATPFVYDFHFYHHPNEKFTTRLRRRMMKAMLETRPRFIIKAMSPWRPAGPGTIRNFVALDRLVANQYREVWSGEKLVLLERRF